MPTRQNTCITNQLGNSEAILLFLTWEMCVQSATGFGPKDQNSGLVCRGITTINISSGIDSDTSQGMQTTSAYGAQKQLSMAIAREYGTLNL
jgi:hypothetical protein